jgi:hypothetical protein
MILLHDGLVELIVFPNGHNQTAVPDWQQIDRSHEEAVLRSGILAGNGSPPLCPIDLFRVLDRLPTYSTSEML